MISFSVSNWLFIILVVPYGQPIKREQPMLDTVEVLDAGKFRCSEVVQVLNHLRGLGKEKCIERLAEYLSKTKDDSKVLILCRLLFVNPAGWKPPRIGVASPEIHQELAEKYPLFPIELVDNVPLSLVIGYRGGGRGESAASCLKACKELSLIDKDYPTEGFDKAANKLIESKSFKALYRQKDDLSKMSDFVLRQAR